MWRNDQARYVGGFALLAASIPALGYLGYKYVKDPIKNGGYLAPNAYLFTFSMIFFAYSTYKHKQV